MVHFRDTLFDNCPEIKAQIASVTMNAGPVKTPYCVAVIFKSTCNEGKYQLSYSDEITVQYQFIFLKNKVLRSVHTFIDCRRASSGVKPSVGTL